MDLDTWTGRETLQGNITSDPYLNLHPLADFPKITNRKITYVFRVFFVLNYAVYKPRNLN